MQTFIYLITIINFMMIIANIKTIKKKQEIYVACTKNKELKITPTKSLNFSDDMDFIQFLLLLEHVKFGDLIYSKPSERLLTMAEILSAKSAANYQAFIKEEKEKLIEKCKKTRGIAIYKTIVSLIVFSVCIFSLLSIF